MINKEELAKLNQYRNGLSMLSNVDYMLFKSHIRYFLKSRGNELFGFNLKTAMHNLADDVCKNYDDFMGDL